MISARPILFSAPMVRALLDGRKTQTRRLLKPQPPEDYRVVWHEALGQQIGFSRLNDSYQPRCPYGVPGDLLWVRETFVIENTYEYHGEHEAPSDERPLQKCSDGGGCSYFLIPHYRASEPEPHIVSFDADSDDDRTRWRPAIFMPRWASRLTLQITCIKVERLQDISEADAIAEGVTKIKDACHVIKGFDYDEVGLCHTSAVTPYYKLWEHLNGPGSWEANPWVCALTFEVHKANVDDVLLKLANSTAPDASGHPKAQSEAA